MNDAHLRVAEAEAQLKTAKAAEVAEQQEHDRKQLAAIRQSIRTAHTEYEHLRQAIRNGEVAVAAQQAHVDAISGYISESIQLRPAAADFLPYDPEVRAWRERHAELVRRRDLAIARRVEIQSGIPPRAEAAKYEGNFGLLANLQRSETNLIRKLKREPIGANWQGGVSRVL